MSIQVGDRIPDVQLTLATPEGPVPVKSGDYFAGKRVALFAVPGAYTPTCSARHLPSYVEKSQKGEIPLDTFITHNMGLDQINEAFELMHEGKSIRTVIHF